MTDDDDFDIVDGSGNVFRDFGYPDADLRQAKCLMAAEIMKILDERGWSTRRAQDATGIGRARRARLRTGGLSRCALGRWLSFLSVLGQEVQRTVSVRPRHGPARPAPPG